jgi:hypothetical protein
MGGGRHPAAVDVTTARKAQKMEMEEDRNNHEAQADTDKPAWRDLPFDATTNFSIMGWILDRLGKGRRSAATVDLRLEA